MAPEAQLSSPGPLRALTDASSWDALALVCHRAESPLVSSDPTLDLLNISRLVKDFSRGTNLVLDLPLWYELLVL